MCGAPRFLFLSLISRARSCALSLGLSGIFTFYDDGTTAFGDQGAQALALEGPRRGSGHAGAQGEERVDGWF